MDNEFSVYTVKENGKRLLDNFRGDMIFGNVYVIYKQDIPTYEVVTSTIGDWCNCPGYRNHGNCKHMQMVYNAKEKL